MPDSSTLPPGWVPRHSKTHNRTYYLHEPTGKTQWTSPATQPASSAAQPQPQPQSVPLAQPPPSSAAPTTECDPRADAQAIVAFYNTLAAARRRGTSQLPASSREGRTFQNFLKAALFHEVTYDLRSAWPQAPLRVLDAACGSGGDLAKWAHVGASEYRGFDAAEGAVQALRERQGMRPPRVHATVGDFTSPEAWRAAGERQWDVVSCQFALHYAFCTEEAAHVALRGIGAALSERGRVIITVPDASEWRFRAASAGAATGAARVSAVQPQMSDFGDRYMFHMQGCVDAPEWWVHYRSLFRVARQAGLEIVWHANLASVAAFLGVDSHRGQPARRLEWETYHAPLLRRMCGSEGATAVDWQTASFYCVFVLARARASDRELPVLHSLTREFHSWSLHQRAAAGTAASQPPTGSAEVTTNTNA